MAPSSNLGSQGWQRHLFWGTPVQLVVEAGEQSGSVASEEGPYLSRAGDVKSHQGPIKSAIVQSAPCWAARPSP